VIRRRIVVIGAGGFAREVKWLISEINTSGEQFDFLGFVVSDLSQLGPRDSKNDVVGDYQWIEQNRDRVDCLALGIGNPVARATIGDELTTSFPNVGWPQLIHPSVCFDRGSCEIGKGVLLCAGTIGTVNLKLESFCMVNLACTIGHEARIGRGTVLNPTVNISGGVTLEDEVLVGTGAQILQYVTVGRGATVGAGAVVSRPVEPGSTVVGIPAKPIKRT